jgi:hypothetical protein
LCEQPRGTILVVTKDGVDDAAPSSEEGREREEVGEEREVKVGE